MEDFQIGSLTLGMCQTNCYYLYREGRNDVLFFDPADRGEELYQALQEKGLRVGAILLTHGHFDHIWGVEKLKGLSDAEVYAYEGEEALLGDAKLNVSASAGRACTIRADHLLKDGENISLCGFTAKVIATPGHTGGSCCYYFEKEGILFSGDTLFLESVGRTDFPTGSMSALVRSIREKLFVLPDEVKVYPGHGPATSIGYEKENNAFI